MRLLAFNVIKYLMYSLISAYDIIVEYDKLYRIFAYSIIFWSFCRHFHDQFLSHQFFCQNFHQYFLIYPYICKNEITDIFVKTDIFILALYL